MLTRQRTKHKSETAAPAAVKTPNETPAGKTLRTREALLARWAERGKADPETLLRHVSQALHEKSEWCEEQAIGAFDCMDSREDAACEMLNWKTIAGELRALEDLIRDQIETDEE